MIQLEGNIKFGADSGSATDYSLEVASLMIGQKRTTTKRPATFGNANASDKAGEKVDSLTVNFLNDVASTSLTAELDTAINTDSAELYWEGTLIDAAVSADNPKYSGVCVITDLDIGGDVGVQNTQRKTWPITEAGITRTITP